MYDLGVARDSVYILHRENIDTPKRARSSRQPRSRQPHRRPFKASRFSKGTRKRVARALCAANGSGCIGPGVKH